MYRILNKKKIMVDKINPEEILTIKIPQVVGVVEEKIKLC